MSQTVEGICRGCGQSRRLNPRLQLCQDTWAPQPNPRIADALEPRPDSCLASFLRWAQNQPVLVDCWLEAGGLATPEQKAADAAAMERATRLPKLIQSIFGEALPAAMQVARAASNRAEPTDSAFCRDCQDGVCMREHATVTKKVTKVLDAEKDPT